MLRSSIESWATLARSRARNRHPKYYFKDGTVIFLVQSTLFKVHRYFFERDSPIFESMFSLPLPQQDEVNHYVRETSGIEGQSDENPICLERICPIQFEHFLSVFYPKDFASPDLTSLTEWTSVLALSTQWDFASIRKLSLQHLTKILETMEIADRSTKCSPVTSTSFAFPGPPSIPVSGNSNGVNALNAIRNNTQTFTDSKASPTTIKLSLARSYDVKEWMVPSYTDLCARYEPLNLEEGRMLGMDDVVFIGNLRQAIRYPSNLNRDPESVVRLVKQTMLIE